jgi:L-glyceraldehyde 3-phosphate reductase
LTYVPAQNRYDGLTPYRRSGRSGLDLPAISLGLWHNFGGADVFETGRAVLRRAFDRGVTHFDLANNYGPGHMSQPALVEITSSSR